MLQFAAYALPALPLAVVVFPSHAILPGFYAQHTRIPIAVIGMILIVARVFDAVIDPLIGFLSDATMRRWKSRKPWLALGAVLLALAVLPLYSPSSTVGAGYFLGWFLAFYLGYSLVEVPLKAWGTELARNYRDRSRIATCLAVAFGLGNLAFALAPFFMASDARSFDARTLAAVGWGVAIAMPATLVMAAWIAPDGTVPETEKTRIRSVLRALHRNRPLLHFLVMFILTGLGQGVFYGMVFLYVTHILGLQTAFVWVLLADALVTLASVPVWYALIRRLQKHRAWALGLGISALSLALMAWLVPGEPGLLPLLVLVCVRAFGSGVTQVAPNALLGDVVDYELFRRNVNQAANFHAMVSLATKFTAATGAGAGLMIAGLVGFDAAAANPPDVVSAFKVIALWVPVLILVIGAWVSLCFPLDRRRHATVLYQLERRVRHAA
jgi:Na+/melibiose symporter-like transporter